jgi:hypothetical protein
MSETQTPPPTPRREGQAIDTLGTKVFFSLMCFLSPVPVAIVIVDFWLRYQGQTPENAINPVYFIKQGMTNLQFAHLWPLLLAMLPSVLVLLLVFRDAKSRVIMLTLLMVAALLAFTTLAQLSSI